MVRVRVEVHQVKGKCAAGLKPGDWFEVDGFYITGMEGRICLHALAAMSTLLTLMSHGHSAKELGIGEERGFLQCPDPGPPLTCGGTVIFKLSEAEVH